MNPAIKDEPPFSGKPAADASFAETALRLGGKSEAEARSLGAVDRAGYAPQRFARRIGWHRRRAWSAWSLL